MALLAMEALPVLPPRQVAIARLVICCTPMAATLVRQVRSSAVGLVEWLRRFTGTSIKAVPEQPVISSQRRMLLTPIKALRVAGAGVAITTARARQAQRVRFKLLKSRWGRGGGGWL